MNQSPTHAGYGGASSRANPDGHLPFTGLDVFLLVGMAILLLTAGLVFRKIGRA